MNEADSMSMTPPLSPEDLILEEPEPSPPPVQLDKGYSRPPCFCCLGETDTREETYHTEGYWKTGYLHRVCSSGRVSPLVSDTVPTLFMFNIPNSAVVGQDLHRLFLMLRQQINEIQIVASRSAMSFGIDSNICAFDKRVNVNEFLQYLQDYLQSGTDISEDTAEQLIHNLHTVLLDVDRLSEQVPYIPQSTGLCGTEAKGSVSHQCFHVHLDVYWRILVLFHLLQDRQPGVCYRVRLCMTQDMDIETSLFDQLLHLMLWDLVSLAQVRFINKVMHGEYLKTSLFSCTCVRELWLLLLNLSQWRAAHGKGESFWISLHHIIKSLGDMEKDSANHNTDNNMEIDDCRVIVNPPEGFTAKDSTGLCLWIMYNVAQLYSIRQPNGNQGEYCSPASNYHDLESLLKNFLAAPSVSENCLRRHLRTSLHLSRMWEPNTSILVPLWNYFYKRLNRSDSFQESSRTLDGLATIDQSVTGLYDHCKAWTSHTDEQLDKDRSYQLFLRILSEHLGKLYSSGATQEWKKMKGRIYSKFHQARVQELTDGGLHNLTCLFLTLALTADLEDVASKLCNFYDMLDIRKCTFAKRSVVWRGAFAMMLVYEDRGMDISFLTDRMVAAFEGAVSDFTVAGIDTRHCLWKLLMIYLEGLQEVVDSSKSLETSEYKLICPQFLSLLNSCSEMEMRAVLSGLQTVITKFRHVACSSLDDYESFSSSKPPLQHMEFAGRLWRNVYPFVVEHSQTLTPPDQVADLAALFCFLALNLSPGDVVCNKQTFQTVFQTFANSDKTNVSVSCRFLGHTLSSDDVMERLGTDMKDRDKVIISAWFRCCLHVSESSASLAQVTRQTLQLSEVKDILRLAEMETLDVDTAPVQFLKAIELAHRKLQSWQEKMKFQEQITQYFSDVPKHVSAVVRAMAPADTVVNVYKMTGLLVKYCAKMIYIRQDAIVPSLINTLIVPHHVMTADKPLNPLLLSALRESLHLYIQGLSKLSFERDAFIQRRLKDIVNVYLPKFSLKSSSMTATMVHPIVKSLRESFNQQPLQDAVKFRHVIMNLVINSFLLVKNFAIHPNHSLGWAFMHDTVQRSMSSEVKARDLPVLLPCCLDYLLLLPDQSNPQFHTVLNILQQLTEAYTYNSTIVKREDLHAICDKFVTAHFKFSSSGVLKVLEKVSVLQKDIVTGVIKKLSGSIREIERKRGVGTDQKLRSRYYQVLQLLGDQGAEEISKMKSEGS